MDCGLKEMRWNMNNEVDNVTLGLKSFGSSWGNSYTNILYNILISVLVVKNPNCSKTL